MSRYDAVIVGAGPNGLAAGIVLAQAGLSVLIREANDTVGGAARSEELTLPGFTHDPFSAVYPLGAGSPLLRTLPLGEHGLEWVQPGAAVAHPLPDGLPALLHRSFDATGHTLRGDGAAYQALLEPFSRQWASLAPELLSPLHLPRHPLLLGNFGLHALRSLDGLVRSRFEFEAARALLGGSAAHTGLPLTKLGTAAFGLVLHAAGHAVGWPVPRGGAGKLTGAMASYFRSLGGEIETGAPVHALDELPASRAVLLDLTPRQILKIAGNRLPGSYRDKLREFRYGVGVFKMDWALEGPIPWREPECALAGTVHLVGSYAELLRAEHQPWNGEHPESPFVLLAQPTLFDPSRAPPGKHVAWAYCHVPNASTFDMSGRIEAQVEHFAPGFRDLILARSILPPAELERRDNNLVGGDVNGGAPLLSQLFFRPTRSLSPYRVPGAENLFICSASTPPGGGVHGMCGYHAARTALRHTFGMKRSLQSAVCSIRTTDC